MKYQYILFDLDGTLIDSSSGIKKSIILTMDALQKPAIDEEKLKLFIGPSLWDSFREYCFMEGEELARAVDTYRFFYSDDDKLFDAYLYDGMRDLLAALQEKNAKTAIATMKLEIYTKRILEKFSLTSLFEVACGSTPQTIGGKKGVIERCLSSLKCIDTSQAVLVGDSTLDAQGALDAGIDFIAAGYGLGFHTQEEIDSVNSVFWANNVAELSDFLLL